MSQRPERARYTEKNARQPVGSPDLIFLGRMVLAVALLLVATLVKMPLAVKIILLVLSVAASGYDLALKAFDSVLEGDYFATPILLLFVTFVSFLIGYEAESAAMLILYQLGLLAIAYVEKRTRGSALQLLNGQDQEIAEKAGELFGKEEASELSMQPAALRSADLILKGAMVFALLYVFILPRLGDYSYSVSIHHALMIVMTAIPASVVAAMPFTALVGLCYSARNGVLFRNGKTMERTADVNVAVFDKAGIFSAAEPELQSFHSDALDERTFMSFVAHAVYYSEQPFAKAIPALGEQDYRLEVISDFVDVPGCGVELKIGGAPVLLATWDYLAARGVQVPQAEEAGEVFYLTVAGRYVGYLCIASQTNETGEELLDGIRDAGMRETVLLTEDGEGESRRLGEELGFDEVFGECDTERKLKHIQDLNQGSRNHVMFLYANGIEAHSDADVDVRLSTKAKYADVMTKADNANALPFAIQIARRMCQVAKENAIFVFAVKALMVFLSILGCCSIWFVMLMDIVAVLASMLNAIRVTKDPLIDLNRLLAPRDTLE